jgi:hypothetical protein
MKKKLFFLFIAASSLLFMGCPYNAEVPIDESSVKIDSKLLGNWESKSSTTYKYAVTRADDKTYRIEKKSETDTSFYKAFLSDVDGVKYLNIMPDDASTSKSYYFYRIEFSGSGAKITLSPVTENIDEKFATSKEMKDFFKKNQGLSFFFAKDDEIYFKAD